MHKALTKGSSGGGIVYALYTVETIYNGIRAV
jgi:hypothetical protein